MPIIVPETTIQPEFYDRLSNAGALVISENDASHQDIRPARIGLLNLMPAAAMKATENQWLRYVSQTVLQIEPVLVKFDDDLREQNGGSRSKTLSRYKPFSEVAEAGLDGLIVTGDNLELKSGPPNEEPSLLPFQEISYAQDLDQVIDWSRTNVFSTIYSCLASHFALNHLYGIERDEPKDKFFGVFRHITTPQEHETGIIRNMDDVIRAPHSRWGNISVEALGSTAIRVLAVSESAGWLLAEEENEAGGKDIYIQGHPEYDRNDLMLEHQRDLNNGVETECPVDYYSEEGKPTLTWANDARSLHSNWISTIYDHFSQTERG